jgi:pimeloyl-ACP methyl ester carboxylesterase
LIHGLGLNRDVWGSQLAELSKNYNVITYDLFWHGEATSPEITPSLTVFSEQLQALLDDCNVDRATIVGFSLGGMIARRFAQDVPKRAEALIILNSPHKRSDEAQAAIVKRVDLAKGQGPAATVEAALERWFTDLFRTENPDMMNKVRGWVMSNNPDTYPSVYHVLAAGIDEIVQPSPPISCPTLVLTGDEDYGNGPEMTQAIANEIVDSEVVILKNLRHMALMEAPAVVNRPILAFLDKVYQKGVSDESPACSRDIIWLTGVRFKPHVVWSVLYDDAGRSRGRGY